ncbi:hypothetical protein ACFQVA_04070 [Actinomadura keratinilytica]
MALALDERPVVSEREGKSVSVEDTYDLDIHDRVRVRGEVARLAERCTKRLREAGRSGRTVVLKVRRYDFSTLTRSETLRGPTDDPAVVREAAARLLEGVDTTGGVRLLGVGVSGLADYTQEDLFAQAAGERAAAEAAAGAEERLRRGPRPRRWTRSRGRPGGAALARRSRRGPRRPRARLGPGQRGRTRDRPVRDADLGAGPGAYLPHGRPGAEPVGAAPPGGGGQRARRG